MNSSEPSALAPSLKRTRFLIVTAILFVLFLAGLVLNINTGSVSIPAADIFRMLLQSIRFKIADFFTSGKYTDALNAVMNTDTASQILFRIRLPRVLLAAVLGGALSVS